VSGPAAADGVRADPDRVDRFLAAYNTVDRLLRERTGVADHGVPFRTVLRRFLRDQRWRGAERMEEYAELRNLLVHETLEPDGWLAVPSEQVVRRIEAIRDRLAGGQRADDAFKRRVATVSPTMPLRDALAQAHATGFSQFPVVEDDTVIGLLTDRGLARWLAERCAAAGPLVLSEAVAGAAVADVLDADTDRRTWDLAARDEPADRVLARFVEQPELEAVLVTQHGKRDQKLLGIATHLDVVRFWDGG